MWILLAVVAAVGSAGTSFALKRAVSFGGATVSTVGARLAAGTVLLAVMAAAGLWPALTPAYWRVAGLVIVPEVLGTLFLTLALRAGELSLVQPLLGLMPLLVTVGGAVFLREVPTPQAAAGVGLVTLGVYFVGLQPGESYLAPVRALARSRASWYAVACVCGWSITSLLHKQGIAEVGPIPWAMTLAYGSALGLAVSLPLVRRWAGEVGMPRRTRPWIGFVLLAGACFAVQQIGLQTALRIAQTGYVIAVASTGILIATALGIVLLHERSAARTRAAGAVLVTGGATLIALFG